MLKIWDLAKKSHFASVLATEAVNANFLHTMMNYIENGIHDQILEKNVGEISHPTASTTVKKETTKKHPPLSNFPVCHLLNVIGRDFD